LIASDVKSYAPSHAPSDSISHNTTRNLFKSAHLKTATMNYNLELEKAAKAIKQHKANLVCIQLPDGLKPKAADIQRELEKSTKAKIVIWLGSCFGACDVPDLSKQKVDLLIQWGHSLFKKK